MTPANPHAILPFRSHSHPRHGGTSWPRSAAKPRDARTLKRAARSSISAGTVDGGGARSTRAVGCAARPVTRDSRTADCSRSKWPHPVSGVAGCGCRHRYCTTRSAAHGLAEPVNGCEAPEAPESISAVVLPRHGSHAACGAGHSANSAGSRGPRSRSRRTRATSCSKVWAWCSHRSPATLEGARGPRVGYIHSMRLSVVVLAVVVVVGCEGEPRRICDGATCE